MAVARFAPLESRLAWRLALFFIIILSRCALSVADELVHLGE